MSRDEHSAERLSAYVDGALPVAERLEVEAHLDRCERCRLLLDDLRTLSADLRAEAVPEVPQGLEARVRRALDAERGRRRVVPFRVGWKIPATIAATLGAIALVAISFRFLPLDSRAPSGFLEPARIEVPVETAKTSEPTPPESVPAPPAPQMVAKAAPARDEAKEVVGGRAAEADREDPNGRNLAAAFDTSARPAPPAAAYRTTITIAPGPDCRETFEPFGSALRTAEGNLEAIEDRVDLLSGTRISEEGRPYERTFEVRTEQWAEFLDFLTREGFVAEAEPREIPPGADCVRVRVEFAPALPPAAQPPR
jgi:hypothetical protein